MKDYRARAEYQYPGIAAEYDNRRFSTLKGRWSGRREIDLMLDGVRRLTADRPGAMIRPRWWTRPRGPAG